MTPRRRKAVPNNNGFGFTTSLAALLGEDCFTNSACVSIIIFGLDKRLVT